MLDAALAAAGSVEALEAAIYGAEVPATLGKVRIEKYLEAHRLTVRTRVRASRPSSGSQRPRMPLTAPA